MIQETKVFVRGTGYGALSQSIFYLPGTAEIERNRKEVKRYKVDSVRLLITGIIFVAAGILLSGLINQVLAVIISTIGSFSI